MSVSPSARRLLLERTWAALGGGPLSSSAFIDTAPPVPLPARTDVASLAWASVGASALAAGALSGGRALALDPARVAVSYSSERHLLLDDEQPPVWAPLSGFFRSSDSWVRTHGNYPHHAAELRRGLGLTPGADAITVAAALRGMPAAVATQAITSAGGLCVAVSRENPTLDAALRGAPLVHLRHSGAAHPRSRAGRAGEAPLRGIRVLDLTRVIAGPVATRALALLGAEVLRIDPPGLPEPEWQHLDSGHGKRSALLDLHAPHARAVFDELLASADVVVTGYRAAAMERLGLGPHQLIDRHPGLVVARLTAWGAEPAVADRRGFDSLVQAASGISWIESPDGERPGALPAQALDHSAGYLLAAGVMSAFRHQDADGGSWLVDVSLRRVAAELLGMPRSSSPEPSDPVVDPAPHLQKFDIDGITLVTTAPALAYAGGPVDYRPPRPWGRDTPTWSGRP
ncbi:MULTISPECIES: CoA transferase [unclassified Microbacterium]|uniref:CoA transferase n=1 Tax=unclassified Microbacterium TaxID=2609290 RepID=UPI00214CDAF7|nr:MULTISPECIES: CoA transferase [unclassified Microbacterium]MCR2809972.1 CoA transferase [Microbacterium sp. zg.B185]WIM20185.1 CoA transferase [Microbacterium sp. zg-B185]